MKRKQTVMGVRIYEVDEGRRTKEVNTDKKKERRPRRNSRVKNENKK